MDRGMRGRDTRRRAVLALCLAALVGLAAGGCGKRGTLEPPPDETNTYPRTYPSQ